MTDVIYQAHTDLLQGLIRVTASYGAQHQSRASILASLEMLACSHRARSCSETPAMPAQVRQTEALGIDPIVDYIFPIWPSLNCFNPARTDNSTITPSAGFTNYYNAVQSKANQFITTGLFFTAQYVSASQNSVIPSRVERLCRPNPSVQVPPCGSLSYMRTSAVLLKGVGVKCAVGWTDTDLGGR